MTTVARARRPLPDYVEHEFETYLKCGRLEGLEEGVPRDYAGLNRQFQ